MTAEETAPTSGHVRLRVDLVVEIADAEVLAEAAQKHVEHDDSLPDGERAHARRIVAADSGEAIAYLVDPFVLAAQLPGVELAHASWGCERLAPGDLEALDGAAAVDGLDDFGGVAESAGPGGRFPYPGDDRGRGTYGGGHADGAGGTDDEDDDGDWLGGGAGGD